MDMHEPEDWESVLPPEDPFRMQPISSLMLTPNPRVLVPELLVRGSVGLIVSEPHVGKTMLMLDLGLSLMAGQAFMGKLPTERARMIGFFLGGHGWSTRYQLRALRAGRAAPLDDEW